MVKESYGWSATNVGVKVNLPEKIRPLLMKMDGVMYGAEGQQKPFETQSYDGTVFLGNRYDVENGVVAVIAYDPATDRFSTFVTKSSPELISDLEQAGFRHEPKIGVPHVYNLNLFMHQRDREDLTRAYGEVNKRYGQLVQATPEAKKALAP